MGKVTRGQRLLILLAGIAVVATLMFPPFTMSWPDIEYNMGYAPIFSPPAIGDRTAGVDIPLLLIQWVGIALATACGWLYLATSRASALDERADGYLAVDTPALPLGSQAWRRFWATNIDFFLVVAGLNVAQLTIGWRWPGQIVAAILVGTLITVAFAAFVQATFLALFGTTPGKAFMGIRVVRGNGEKLTFWAALKRSVDVLVGGCGLYLFFPLLQVPLFWMHFNILKREGVCDWDRASDISNRVTVAHSSWLRPVFGASVCFIVLVGVSFIAGLMQSWPQTNEKTVQDMEQCIKEGILTEDQCFLRFLGSN